MGSAPDPLEGKERNGGKEKEYEGRGDVGGKVKLNGGNGVEGRDTHDLIKVLNTPPSER